MMKKPPKLLISVLLRNRVQRVFCSVLTAYLLTPRLSHGTDTVIPADHLEQEPPVTSPLRKRVVPTTTNSTQALDTKRTSPRSESPITRNSTSTQTDSLIPLGMPTFDTLDDCVRGSRAHKCNFNMGKEYVCLREYHTCLQRGSGDYRKVLACKHEFQECRSKARSEYKFNCHDYAFESCRQLKREKFPAWIFGVCDKGDVSGHAMVVVKDVTAAAELQPYYCIHEPQKGTVDRELCWTAQFNNPPEIPKRMIAVLTKKISHYAEVCKGYLKIHECNEAFYENRGESPWYVCGPNGYHTDPLVIPRWVPEHK